MIISSSSKALFAGVSGTAFQWYDFALFGYFSPIIAATYFPNHHPFVALFSAFGVFAVGYLLAPLGSLFFGYMGDRLGRKRALTLSILAMTIPTAFMSIIPSYQSIGIAAPLLIIGLRLIQGFVASAEFTGSAIFLVEHAKPGRKAFYGSLTSSAYSLGSILAGLSAAFFSASFMPDWAWRIGFALALIAGILIFYLRMHVTETPEFLSIAQQDKRGMPFMTALKETPLAVIGIIGLSWLVSIMTFGTYVFAETYLHLYFQFPLSLATWLITIALAVDAGLEPFIAILADRIGLLKVIQFGMTSLFFLSIPIFALIATGHVHFIAVGLVGMSILIAMTYAPLNAYMVSLFPRQYRYSGFGGAFNIGISLFGGTTPLVLLWLVYQTDNLISPAWYYMFGAVIGLGSLRICEQSRRKLIKMDANFA